MSVVTEERPVVRIVEIGCRDFLAVGDLCIPVDEISAINLTGPVAIAAGGTFVITDVAEAEALKQFIYSKV